MIILKDQKFIDLFAGIGGFHQALSQFGAKCVFASELDQHASQTYFINYNIKPFGDITKILAENIPKHDILCAGFPCQAFSISGKQQGFADARGTLFFDIVRIIDFHHPKILLLENVKNFLQHDNGNTLKIVLNILKKLGYKIFYQVLNASNFGLAQNRERLYFIGFRKDIFNGSFNFPKPCNTPVALQDILESTPSNAKVIERSDIYLKNFSPDIDKSGNIILPNRPIQIGTVNKGGQGERIYHPLGHAITLSAYGGGIGAKTGLYKIGNTIRKLSPRECARLQGFPDSFMIISSPAQAYKQFGNSIPIPVLVAILQQIEETLSNNEGNKMQTPLEQKQLLGSQTAKGGFKNEKEIVEKFNQFQTDNDAQNWLKIMGYNIEHIQSLIAVQVPTYLKKESAKKFGIFGISEEQFKFIQKFKKSDVQIQLTITIDNIIYRENISLKKANQTANFNQIDKRSVDTYQMMWGFNSQILNTLKKFTGEIQPNNQEKFHLKDKRRWYLTELPNQEVQELITFFNNNKLLIFNDIIKGRGMLSAEWFLVTKSNKDGSKQYLLKNINEVVNFYAQGDIYVSKQGNLKLGRLTAQRKGGTPDPTALQFKIKPLDIFLLQ